MWSGLLEQEAGQDSALSPLEAPESSPGLPAEREGGGEEAEVSGMPEWSRVLSVLTLAFGCPAGQRGKPARWPQVSGLVFLSAALGSIRTLWDKTSTAPRWSERGRWALPRREHLVSASLCGAELSLQ